ncbi:MAG: hypothetical protein ABFD90_18730 [Phycisphaerales bacterium]
MNRDKDLLGEAVARLKRDALSQEPPKAVIDETLRRLADASPEMGGVIPERSDHRYARSRTMIRLALAAAALFVVGCVIGRLSGPAPVNLDKLRETLAPSLAASIEPAIRAKVVEDLQHRYQLALAATYVKVKDELTEQYRDDLNRFAIQTLAASNATTNRLLTELVENIDTAKAQDLDWVAKVICQIEQNRIQDKTQLAAGLHTLASRTEDEFSRTRRQFVQLLVDGRPEDLGAHGDEPIDTLSERIDP